jgi:hypothetical protein
VSHIILRIVFNFWGIFTIDSLDLYFSISIKNYFLSSKVSYVKNVSHDYYEIYEPYEILWSWIVILTIIIRDMKKLIHHPTSALSLSVNTLLNCCRKPNWLIIKCLFRLANSQYLFITSNYSPVTLSHTFSLCTRLNAAIFKKFSFKALFQHYSYKDLGRSSRPFVQVQWMSTW